MPGRTVVGAGLFLVGWAVVTPGGVLRWPDRPADRRVRDLRPFCPTGRALAEAGTYSVICHEYCGIGHHTMGGVINVEES